MAINPYAGSLTAPFEGNGDCIYDFKDRFMAKTEGLRFNVEDQAALIRSYLIGNAKNVYNKLTNEQKNNINVVFEQLIDKFALTDEEYMSQFNDLKFDYDDGVLSFSLKLEALINKALKGINEESKMKLLKNKFVREMPSTLRAQLSMHVDEEWDTIVSKARKAINLMDKDPVEINKTSVKSKQSFDFGDKVCYNCGEKGHFKSNCPTRRNSYNNRGKNYQNSNYNRNNQSQIYQNSNQPNRFNQANNYNQYNNFQAERSQKNPHVNYGQNYPQTSHGQNYPQTSHGRNYPQTSQGQNFNTNNRFNQNMWTKNNYDQNQFSVQFDHNFQPQVEQGQPRTHEIQTFGQKSSESISFNFISLNPVSVQNDEWKINKAHPLMKVSSKIRLFSSELETRMNLLVDNGASNSLLKFSSLPNDFKQVINNFCTKNQSNRDLKKHSIGIKTCNGDSFSECVVARVWLTIGSWSGEHQFIITDNITNQDGILGRDFLLQYETVIDNRNDTLKINSIQKNMSNLNNFELTEDSVETYFIENKSWNKSCFIPHRQKLVKNCESILEVQLEDSNEFGPNLDVLFEPVQLDSVILAHSLSKVEDGRMFISAINLSDKDIEINTGQKVGTASEVEVETVAVEKTSGSCSNDVDINELDVQIKEKIESILIDTSLKDEEIVELKKLIFEYKDCFSWSENEIGKTNLIKHKINTGFSKPVKQPPYRVPSFVRNQIDNEVEKMLKNGIIRESNSPWASPVVMVKKKNGKFRFCVDYRKLNKLTVKDSFPIPHIDDTLLALDGAMYFSLFDLTTGYWQVEVDEEDIEKTAFATSSGLYEFLVMPFGLTNAPATFQRLMNKVLKGLTLKQCVVYLDDIIVFSRTFREHLIRLRNVFERLRQASLKMQLSKCRLCTNKVVYLGFELTKHGSRPDPNKTQAIVKMEHPIDSDQLRRFMGSINFYRQFIPAFSQIASPLYKLLCKNVKFSWNKLCDEAFNELKNKLVSAPILAYPDFEKKFFIHCDSSNESIGAVLSQQHDGILKPIAFASRRLSPAEKSYTTSEKEALAAVFSLKEFNDFTYGREVELYTDHEPLTTFKSIKDTSSRLNKLIMKIQELAPDVEIRYKPGHLNVEADMLSRATINEISISSSLNWSVEQDKDSNLVELKKLVGSKEESLMIEWSKSGDDFKKSAIRIFEELTIDNDILFFNSDFKLIFVPQHKILEILKSFHDDPLSGHLAHEKTFKRLKIRFFWFNMKKQVKNYCESCMVCQQFKVYNHKNVAVLRQMVAKHPFDIIGIDVVGPLPTTPRGMRYIIVAICFYAKWCETVCTKDFTALTTAKFLINQIICKFGFMNKIVTDQGPNFESNLFKELCNELKIDKLRTTAYHPQSNGEVERQNRTLKFILSKYVNRNHTDWDMYLNSTVFAYNTAVHNTTGKSPYEVLFGRIENGLNDVRFTTEQSKTWSNDFLRKTEENRVKNLQEIELNVKKAKENQKKYYDQNVYMREKFDVGSKVWLKNHVTKVGHSRKFTVKWLGPYLVEKNIDDINFIVKRLSDNKVFTTHYNRMRQFKERSEENSNVENQNSDMIVEKAKDSKICQVENVNFQLNFEMCLFEKNQMVIDSDESQSSMYVDLDGGEYGDVEEGVLINVDQTMLDLNNLDNLILDNNQAEGQVRRNDVNVQNLLLENIQVEGQERPNVENDQNLLNENNRVNGQERPNEENVHVTRSGRIIRQTNKLSIGTTKTKSYN